MKTYKNLYSQIYEYENLFLAFKKARKHKTLKPEVIEFQKNLNENLLLLKFELMFHSYRPKPLKTFIITDPKTRKISKSEFRDRVVHHALCNIIEPILEKSFIYDSYANQKGKGTLKAIKRFEFFMRKVSRNYSIKPNNQIKGFVLKADIQKYFDNVNQEILLKILKNKLKDKKVIWLIKSILNNYTSKSSGLGMPLGNLTSQFFANVYLNELDQYVKQTLKIKYYIRYVDDFVILHNSKEILLNYKKEIDSFLESKLKISLHPDKTKIFSLYSGTSFLGFRIFSNKRLLIKKNIYKFRHKFTQFCDNYIASKETYDDVYNFLEGWFAHSNRADITKERSLILSSIGSYKEISSKEVNHLVKFSKPQ